MAISNGEWAVGKTVLYHFPKTLKWRKAKIRKKLGNGKWELDNG